MVMSPTTLAAEMLNLDPVPTEAEAVQTLADAYATFAAAATAGPQPLTPAGVALGKVAMAAALIGMSAPGAGAAKLTSGVIAFWAAVAGGLTASFVGAVAIVPPPHAGIGAALASAFSANTSSAATKETATALIANAFYSQAIIGGAVTYPLSIVAPIL